MFELFDLSVERNFFDAFVFYFFYFLILGYIDLSAALIVHIVFDNSNDIGYHASIAAGAYTNLLLCTGLAIAIKIVKKLKCYMSSIMVFSTFFLVIVSPILFGLLIGLIPIAILTMKEDKSIKIDDDDEDDNKNIDNISF